MNLFITFLTDAFLAEHRGQRRREAVLAVAHG